MKYVQTHLTFLVAFSRVGFFFSNEAIIRLSETLLSGCLALKVFSKYRLSTKFNHENRIFDL